MPNTKTIIRYYLYSKRLQSKQSIESFTDKEVETFSKIYELDAYFKDLDYSFTAWEKGITVEDLKDYTTLVPSWTYNLLGVEDLPTVNLYPSVY